MRRARIAEGVLCLLLGLLQSSAQAQAPAGILLLAHGGSATWNATVTGLATCLNERIPVEVGFGMASRSAMQGGIDRLIGRGATSIVAVPFFVSSHSSVIESIQYLLGIREEAPVDLLRFARMQHADAAEPSGHGAADATRPNESSVPITMSGALDDHPIVGEILAARAQAISREPAREVVILVAHGPVRDEENARWLDDMRSVARQVATARPFARVDYMTLRDDAPPQIRNAAAAELRAAVERATSEGNQVLVVPLLLSYGGIEQGIRDRLRGLDYRMAVQGLMPDARLRQWVLESAGQSAIATDTRNLGSACR